MVSFTLLSYELSGAKTKRPMARQAQPLFDPMTHGGPGYSVTKEIRDDGDRVRAGRPHRLRLFERNPANCHKRLCGETAQASQLVDANDRIGIRFRAGREYRTQREIVDRLGNRVHKLRLIMRGMPQDAF